MLAFSKMVAQPLLIVGRYELHQPIASGGMAQVHVGRLRALAGFTRIVAIKRMLPQLASDPSFVAMFLDEANLAGRVHHPNVVPMLDVVALDAELLLVMEYVPGLSLSRVCELAVRSRTHMPLAILSAVMSGVARGLHGAHEASDSQGVPLGIVHRDVSPQNVLIGSDGVTRVLDFGIAKALGRSQVTGEGEIKGKLSYMSPEQLCGTTVNRTSDIFSTGVVLWELLTSDRLFVADNVGSVAQLILSAQVPNPIERRKRGGFCDDEDPRAVLALAHIARRALDHDARNRFNSAEELEAAIADAVRPATASELSRWLREVGSEVLDARARVVAAIDGSPSLDAVPFLSQSQAAYALTDPSTALAGDSARGPGSGPSFSSRSGIMFSASGSVPGVTRSEFTGLPVGTARSRTIAMTALALVGLVGVFVLAWLGARLGSTSRANATPVGSMALPSTAPPARAEVESVPPVGKVASSNGTTTESPGAASVVPNRTSADPARGATTVNGSPHPGKPRTSPPTPRTPLAPATPASGHSPPATTAGCHVTFSLGPDGEKVFRQECPP